MPEVHVDEACIRVTPRYGRGGVWLHYASGRPHGSRKPWIIGSFKALRKSESEEDITAARDENGLVRHQELLREGKYDITSGYLSGVGFMLSRTLGLSVVRDGQAVLNLIFTTSRDETFQVESDEGVLTPIEVHQSGVLELKLELSYQRVLQAKKNRRLVSLRRHITDPIDHGTPTLWARILLDEAV